MARLKFKIKKAIGLYQFKKEKFPIGSVFLADFFSCKGFQNVAALQRQGITRFPKISQLGNFVLTVRVVVLYNT